MKIRISITFLFSLFLLLTTSLTAQTYTSEMAIKSSVICDMCKKNVQKALALKGVEKSSVNLDTKVITVTYDPQKISPDKIRSAISKAGYDADDVKADPKAYKKLAKCCKKESGMH